jgi:hypothetical protein
MSVLILTSSSPYEAPHGFGWFDGVLFGLNIMIHVARVNHQNVLGGVTVNETPEG